MCLNVVRVAIEMNNWMHVQNYVAKAEQTPDVGVGFYEGLSFPSHHHPRHIYILYIVLLPRCLGLGIGPNSLFVHKILHYLNIFPLVVGRPTVQATLGGWGSEEVPALPQSMRLGAVRSSVRTLHSLAD